MAVTRRRSRTFVRLKLRLTVNGLRGQTWRVALFVLGIVHGRSASRSAGTRSSPSPVCSTTRGSAGMLLTLGGAAVVLGWLFLPLVFFGVDESLDPARFALLPLTRRTLIAGLFVAVAGRRARRSPR